MQLINPPRLAIAGFLSLAVAMPSTASQLQPGFYWGGGSRYITIIRRQDNNRLCYQGASPRGTAIASLTPLAENPQLYVIHGFDAIALTQPNANTLYLGQLSPRKTSLRQPAPFRLEGLATPTAELKQCLNSSSPFYRAIAPNRARY